MILDLGGKEWTKHPLRRNWFSCTTFVNSCIFAFKSFLWLIWSIRPVEELAVWLFMIFIGLILDSLKRKKWHIRSFVFGYTHNQATTTIMNTDLILYPSVSSFVSASARTFRQTPVSSGRLRCTHVFRAPEPAFHAPMWGPRSPDDVHAARPRAGTSRAASASHAHCNMCNAWSIFATSRWNTCNIRSK
jgi:hypothetical protein